MRLLVLLGYFVIGLLLGGYSAISNADTIAATVSYGYAGGGCPVNPASGLSSFSAAVSSFISAFDGQTTSTSCGTPTFSISVTSYTPNESALNINVVFSQTFNTSTPTTNTGLTLTKPILVTYTCPSGYDGPDASHMCTSTALTCDLPVGTVLYSGYYDVGTSSTGAPPSIVCKNHCVGVGYLSGPDYTAMVAGVKHYYYTGTYEIDPGTPQQNYCATDTPAQDVSNSTTAPSNTCPAGQAVGYVNGIAVCYDQPTTTTSTPPISSDKKVETTTAPDGTKTETTTETAADGSKTVTVVVTPPEGSTAPQTTTTSKTPPADPVAAASFCQQNPNEPVCKANKSECELHPGTVGCMAPGVPSDGQTINHETRSISQITAVSMPTFAANADTRTVSLLSGLTLDFSYKPLNDFALMIRPFILALAWLSAALIFIRGFND